jgi:hypothetical protein
VADKNDDDLYDSVAAMADRLGLKGRERSTYVHEHMTRGGYRAVPNYVKADDGDDDDDHGSGFFGSSRSRRRSSGDANRSGSRSRRSQSDDDDWYND